MPTTSQPRHWRSAVEALAVLRTHEGVSRRDLGARLGLGSGPTSDLVARLRAAELVSERPAAPTGRGRPTTLVGAHPDGPVAVAVDIRHRDWRIGVCGVDGELELVAHGAHDGRAPEVLLDRLRAQVRTVARHRAGRVAGIGITVPGQTDGTRLLQAPRLQWHDLDLGRIASALDVPVVTGNDATMAALAEARLCADDADVLLHLVVEVGVGGALVVDGRPAGSRRGGHGEFGHLPFGRPREQCPCGARGCWGVGFDAEHVAARLGVRTPRDHRAFLARTFTGDRPTPAQRRTRRALAGRLGHGVAGLINALDPQLVTLGGLAAPLRAAAPDAFAAALNTGLMDVHRSEPVEVRDARSGDDGALVGGGLAALDTALDADAIAAWAATRATTGRAS